MTVKERRLNMVFGKGFVAASAPVTEEPDVEESQVMWEGVLALEGMPTDDGRFLIVGEQEHRELPLTLMAQLELAPGHDGAVLAGRIDEVWWKDSSEFDGVREIWGRGPFDTSDQAMEVARLVDEQFLRGVSIDYAASSVKLLDPETYEEINEDDIDFMDLLFGGGDFLTGMSGKILGATLVPHPAFEHAEVVTASGSPFVGRMRTIRPAPVTASGAGMAPIDPPKPWFFRPEADGPTPLTVTDDGEVYGHLAVWGECHAGYTGVCRQAPHSYSGYEFFHLGEIATEEGDRVAVGRITVGGGHAPLEYGREETVEHYDEAGCVAAFVRASDGVHGIWLSGAVRSDAPAEKVRDLMANPPSGDWREARGALELSGILSVPVPGFPVPRSEARLVASGFEDDRVEALIQSSYQPDAPLGPRGQRRRRGVLSLKVTELGRKKRKKPYGSREERRKAALDERTAA